MKIGFASDHRGYQLKKYLIEELEKNYEIEDYGTYSEESVDYPDYAFILGENVVNKNVDLNVFKALDNINLNCVLGTKKDGIYKSFLDDYDKN